MVVMKSIRREKQRKFMFVVIITGLLVGNQKCQRRFESLHLRKGQKTKP